MTFRTLLSLLIVYFIKYNKMDKENIKITQTLHVCVRALPICAYFGTFFLVYTLGQKF